MEESTLFSSAQRAAELDPIPGRSLERVSLVKTSDFASPRSRGFAPSFVSMMLPGLRSRWTMPARCALSRAAAISTAVFEAVTNSEL